MSKNVTEKHGPEKAREFLANVESKFAKAQKSVEALKEHFPSQERWFAPVEGLRTVRGLIAIVDEKPNEFQRPSDLRKDLEDLERYLSIALEHKRAFSPCRRYLTSHLKYMDPDQEEWLSLGDAGRPREVVCPDDWQASAGLFVPPESAWLAIREFCQSATRSGEIAWIRPEDVPEDGNW